MDAKPESHEGTTGSHVIYQFGVEKIHVQAVFHEQTLWFTQKMLTDLFESSKQNVSAHLKRIFEDGELIEAEVVKDIAFLDADGKRHTAKHYKLDAVIALSYRVKTKRTIAFRKWAIQVLHDYTLKGYAIDEQRLKNGESFLGRKYFEEMLERIRDIRASERRFYQKLTDIFEQCSVDYDKDSEITRHFFASIMNKMHWAITRQSESDTIYSRVDHSRPNVGMSTWNHAPDGRIYQVDVTNARNYLVPDELSRLNYLVSKYLDYAERLAQQGVAMTMNDWVKRLDAFLQFTMQELIQDPDGIVSKAVANAFAIREFELYRKGPVGIYKSDFDNLVSKVQRNFV